MTGIPRNGNRRNYGRGNQQRIINPEPGTVISDEVTGKNDFYLISIKTRQGTSTPTHYTVVTNDLLTEGMSSKESLVIKEKL